MLSPTSCLSHLTKRESVCRPFAVSVQTECVGPRSWRPEFVSRSILETLRSLREPREGKSRRFYFRVFSLHWIGRKVPILSDQRLKRSPDSLTFQVGEEGVWEMREVGTTTRPVSCKYVGLVSPVVDDDPRHPETRFDFPPSRSVTSGTLIRFKFNHLRLEGWTRETKSWEVPLL